jgi:DUF4097 and DUF4098 domain-containing protein YvlB
MHFAFRALSLDARPVHTGRAVAFLTTACSTRVALLLLVAAMTTACGLTQEVRELPVEAMSFEVLDLQTSSGQVVVTTGAEPSMTATMAYSGRTAPEVDLREEAGTLVVRVDCPPGAWHCKVDFQVVVPSEVALILEVSSGSVEVTGTTGGVEADVGSGSLDLQDVGGGVQAAVSSGSIDLRDIRGALTATASSGTVQGVRLDSSEVYAETSSGTIVLELERIPDRIDASCSSGGVDVTVPVASYDLRLSTGSGSISVDNLTDDNGSPRIITIATGSGGIAVRGR